MILDVIQVLMVIQLAGALLFAGTLGGRPERAAAMILSAGLFMTWGAQAIGGFTPEIAFLLIDVGIGVGLFLVLLRWRLFWSGVACCAQTLMLAFTATRFFNFPLSEEGYVAMLQVSTFIVSAALIYGTWLRRSPPQDAFEAA